MLHTSLNARRKICEERSDDSMHGNDGNELFQHSIWSASLTV